MDHVVLAAAVFLGGMVSGLAGRASIAAAAMLALAMLIALPGALPPELLRDVLVAIPVLAAGTAVGMLLFGKVAARKVRSCVLGLVFVSGCLMIG
jgi:ABC-type histidine transport system ATPase subunit